MQEQDPDSHLKVSDRRHFTDRGERRPEVEAREYEETVATPKPPAVAAAQKPTATSPAAAAPPPPAPAAPAKTPAPVVHERLAEREINFAGLLEQLYVGGMMQLGAEVAPGQAGPVDLDAAAETIDLLGILQQKTHGNLTPQEDRLLNGMLYEMRLGYVQVKQASARVQPAATMPPPPPPRGRR